jgi:hypothetical protein
MAELGSSGRIAQARPGTRTMENATSIKRKVYGEKCSVGCQQEGPIYKEFDLSVHVIWALKNISADPDSLFQTVFIATWRISILKWILQKAKKIWYFIVIQMHNTLPEVVKKGQILPNDFLDIGKMVFLGGTMSKTGSVNGSFLANMQLLCR